MCINLTWNRRVCVGVAFLCLLCAFLLSFTTLKWIGQQHFAKTKRDGVHFFTLKLECHNSYNNLLLCDSANGDIAWCNKNKSEWGFCVFLKKERKPVSFQKTPKNEFEKTEGLEFFEKKRVFLNPDYLSILFCDFPVMARSGTTDVTISLIGRARYT